MTIKHPVSNSLSHLILV